MPSSSLFEPILFFLCQKEKNGAAKMLAGNARPYDLYRTPILNVGGDHWSPVSSILHRTL